MLQINVTSSIPKDADLFPVGIFYFLFFLNFCLLIKATLQFPDISPRVSDLKQSRLFLFLIYLSNSILKSLGEKMDG